MKMKRCFFVALLAGSLFSFCGAFQSLQHLPALRSQYARRCPSPHGVIQAAMVRRDGQQTGVGGTLPELKNKAKRLMAAISLVLGTLGVPKIAGAASAPAAAPPTSAYEQTEPLITLPSQRAYLKREAAANDPSYENPVVRIVKDQRLWAGVGVAAAGAGGYVFFKESERKKNEELRGQLRGLTGLEIDASILDESRINRPGAKAYQFSSTPKFGTYRSVSPILCCWKHCMPLVRKGKLICKRR